MSRKYKKVCIILNYIKHFLILAFTVTGCISISAFVSLIGILVGTTSSAIGLKICAIAKSISQQLRKKEEKHNKIVLLAKPQLNSIEVLIFHDLIDSNISHDDCVLENNVLTEYDEMKQKIKKFKDLIKLIEDFSLFIKQCYHIV